MSWALNSGHQAWRQVPLPAEPSPVLGTLSFPHQFQAEDKGKAILMECQLWGWSPALTAPTLRGRQYRSLPSLPRVSVSHCNLHLLCSKFPLLPCLRGKGTHEPQDFLLAGQALCQLSIFRSSRQGLSRFIVKASSASKASFLLPPSS